MMTGEPSALQMQATQQNNIQNKAFTQLAQQLEGMNTHIVQQIEAIATYIAQIKERQAATTISTSTIPTIATSTLQLRVLTLIITLVDNRVRRPKPVLPNVEMYNGINKAAYQTFYSKLWVKLMLDQAAISSYYGCI